MSDLISIREFAFSRINKPTNTPKIALKCYTPREPREKARHYLRVPVLTHRQPLTIPDTHFARRSKNISYICRCSVCDDGLHASISKLVQIRETSVQPLVEKSFPVYRTLKMISAFLPQDVTKKIKFNQQ